MDIIFKAQWISQQTDDYFWRVCGLLQPALLVLLGKSELLVSLTSLGVSASTS